MQAPARSQHIGKCWFQTISGTQTSLVVTRVPQFRVVVAQGSFSDPVVCWASPGGQALGEAVEGTVHPGQKEAQVTLHFSTITQKEVVARCGLVSSPR